MSNRRRYIALAVALVSCVGVLNCVTAGVSLSTLPAHINSNALRDSILNELPANNRFLRHEGDAQYIKFGAFVFDVYGVIEPHDSSHITRLYHRKVLARIRVNRGNYRDLKPGGWNYWIVVDTSSNGSGKFTSAYVTNNTTPLYLRPLSLAAPDSAHLHTHASARWRNNSEAAPWATCGPAMCCCEGSSCNDSRYYLAD